MIRSAVGLSVLLLVASTARAQNLPQWKHALDFAGQQLQKTAAGLPVNESPQATDASGQWGLVLNTAPVAWTQGFYPGSLWYLYALTGDATYKNLADQWTNALAWQETNTATHDLGFKLFLSFGHGYEFTGDEAYHQAVLQAAASLATRYRPQAGIVSMGDWNTAWKMPIVVDTMMNIELLIWAARHGGDPAWENMAIAHATTTLRDLVRPDGSTYGASDYDPVTGKLTWLGTLQGYSNTSTWTRGQTWAMYGFARMYRYTKRPEFLDASRRTTELYLSRLPADLIPPWDFDSPNQQKDSSAGAIAAAALLELADVETDATAAVRYRSLAVKMLDTLSGPDYLAEGTSSQGVLLHGVGNYQEKLGVNASLVYGDYFFIEAILRAQAAMQMPTDTGIPQPVTGPMVLQTPGTTTSSQGGGTTTTSPGGTASATAATHGGCSTFGASGLALCGLLLLLRRRKAA